MPVNTSYLGQGRGPIGLTSSFTFSGVTITSGAQGATSGESQIAVPARLTQGNRASWLTGDVVIMAPSSAISQGCTWVSYVSSQGTVVLRISNASSAAAVIAGSIVWTVMGFAPAG